MKNKIILLIIFMIYICPSFSNNRTVFPTSTEMQIGRIKTIVDRAPKGMFLTVGGERAFRGASMFEGIDYLLIFDIAPEIIKFNRINMELLKAPNKEDYKHLRWVATFLEWKKVSSSLTEDDFKWWDEHVRNVKGYDLPESLNRYGQGNKFITVRTKLMSFYPQLSKKYMNYEKAYLKHVSWSDIETAQKTSKDPISKQDFEWFDEQRKAPDSCVQKFIENPDQAVDWGQVIDYQSGNYLFDDKLYQRLHDLVLAQKIKVLQLDLTKQEGIDLLVKAIKELQTSLAIIDLDNLYRFEYLGEENFRKALFQLLPFGGNNSILILMSNYIDFPCAQFSIYFGFTFENVRTWQEEPFIDAFMDSIPHDILPLMNGRLYEGNDKLPLYFMKPKY